ncbi:MAG: DUF3617 domain-containing protein [Proteobacteria bacterium]|nr:DUF3617 domain-containing protein [Pseudomonadota bacterium]
MRRNLRFQVLAAVALASAMSGAALAEHGKAGEWDITVKNEFPGMPETSPAERERLLQQGIQMPDTRTRHYSYCMTAEQVASDQPPVLSDRNKCAVSNPRIQGQSFSADITCAGLMKGAGGISLTYDKPEHYSGSARVEGMLYGQEVEMISKFDGTWTSPTCDKDD